MALNGYTFNEMEVPAGVDGGLYQKLLSTDGKVWGCELSSTVETITINTGVLVCAGRLVAFDGATTFSLPSAYSTSTGFVRLVLTLDLSKENSSGFAQGFVEWQYSTTQTFPALTQADNFNNPFENNQKYQMQLCVYPLTSGNIGDVTETLATSATPDLPLSGGTMTGTLVAPSPEFIDAINIKGNGTRKLNARWASNGAGNSVYLYITPASGSEQRVASIAATGSVSELVLSNPSSIEIAANQKGTATKPDGITLSYNRIFNIPGATIVDVGGQYTATSDGIPNGGVLFQLPSSLYYPQETFQTWCFAQLNSGEVIRATATISTGGQCTISLQSKTVSGVSITGIRYFRIHAAIPRW